MSTEEFVQAVPEAEVITEGILFSVAFVIITIISAYNVYIFRNETCKPPKLDQLGRIISWTTFISICFYWITAFLSMYTHIFSKGQCFAVQQLLQIAYLASKLSFWHVLALRF